MHRSIHRLVVTAAAAGALSAAHAQPDPSADRQPPADERPQQEGQAGRHAPAEQIESSGSAEAAASAAPVDVVERLHAGLVELAMRADGAPLEERIERLRPLITSTHDLPYIAELTIRRAWPSVPAEERERFVAAFERLSVATYASRFAEIEGDPFRTLEAGAGERGRARVSAEIDPADAEPIPLDYQLHETEAGWRIVNIVADGVSDLALKRAEYAGILDDGDIEDLIAELESQIAAMD